jgi:hypothetical protein
MELPRSSSVMSGIAGRIRRLFLMELSPNPPPEVPGGRVFRAWRYWNSGAIPIVGASTAAFSLVLGGILIGLTRTLPWISALLMVYGVATPLVLFPGKLAALYPYAVVLEEERGLRLYTPLGAIYFPIEQVKGVRWSWVYGGWVVTVKKRYGLLSGFLIHFAWGRQGRELAQAIGEELARRT